MRNCEFPGLSVTVSGLRDFGDTDVRRCRDYPNSKTPRRYNKYYKEQSVMADLAPWQDRDANNEDEDDDVDENVYPPTPEKED